MGREVLPREYRLKAGRMWFALLWTGGACLAVLIALAQGGFAPTWLMLLLTALSLSFMGWLRFAYRRARTVVDARGIEIRGLIRHARFPWTDIRDIRARPNPAAARNRLAPAYFADIYDPNGKRTQLPWIDSAHVDVVREVDVLRTVWDQARRTP
ncbi:PH domain-containing protein [Streptomyces sp. NPDC057307]|uniref:PH domain-containing protein n=1 Tax=Streptomyces sp. NPDC057307 TaxID=3346096 RepID=UPI003629281B